MILQGLFKVQVVYFLMVKDQPHERAGFGFEAQRVLIDLVCFIAVLVDVPVFGSGHARLLQGLCQPEEIAPSVMAPGWRSETIGKSLP